MLLPLALLAMLSAKVELSETPSCTGLVNLGNPSAITGTWWVDHLSHPSADPLRCIVVTDKPTFVIHLASLPSSATVSMQPMGPSYTSTAQVDGHTVTVTWPLAPATEIWQMNVQPNNGKGPILVPVKIQRPA